ALSAAAKRADISVQNGRIAFTAAVKGTPQVFTISPDGTELTQVTHSTLAAGEWGIAWSPDGSSLAFEVTQSHDVMYRAHADGSGRVRLSPACTGNCLGDDFPAYAPSGAKFAFERGFGPVEDNSDVGA